MTDQQSREAPDTWVGIALVFGALAFAATFVTGRHYIAGLPVDAVVVGVPLAAIVAIPYLALHRTVRLRWELISWPTGIFIAAGLLSVIANDGRVGDLMTVFRYAMYAVIAVVTGGLATDPRFRRLALWSIVAAGALTAIVAAVQYVNLEPTAGLAGLEPEIATRVRATFDNANTYAEYLILVLGAGLALSFTETGRLRRLVMFLSLVLFGALLLTYTRGSWLALAIALAIAVPIAQPKLVLPIVSLAAAAVALSPGVFARVAGMLKMEGTAVFRIQLWRIGLAALAARPVLGYGPGNFLEAYEATVMERADLFAGYLRYGAHNSYLTLAVEVGVVGALAFIVLVVFLATRGLFIVSREGVPGARKGEALMLGAGLMAFVLNSFTSNCFQHPQAAVFFWLLAGLLIGSVDAWLDAPLAAMATPGPRGGVLGDSAMYAVWFRLRSWFRSAWRDSVLFRVGTVQPQPLGVAQTSLAGRAVRRLCASSREA